MPMQNANDGSHEEETEAILLFSMLRFQWCQQPWHLYLEP